MFESRALPSISVILEWENAKTSELGRARDMLVTLMAQLKQLSNRFTAPPELVLVYDAEHGAAEQVLEYARPELEGFPGNVRALPATGLDYYDQKNFGVREARNELILFLDSDVIPEEGWLENLICALLEEDADVCGGCAHMPTNTFYEKAFAAFWFFPVRGEYSKREVAGGFAANNVLFRAEIARRNPFPQSAQVRGRCVELAKALRATGHKIILEPAARVSHPPPNGLSHFVRRSLCEGQSQVFKRSRSGDRLIALKQFFWNVRSSASRTLVTRKQLHLSTWGVAGAMGLAAVYYAIALVGEVVTLVSPSLIRNHVRV